MRLRFVSLVAGTVFAAGVMSPALSTTYTENFDTAANWAGGTMTSYTTDKTYVRSGHPVTYSVDVGTIRQTAATQDTFPATRGSSTYSWRLQDTGTGSWIAKIASGGVGTFSVYVRRWDSSPAVSYVCEYSTDNGANFTTVQAIDNTWLGSSDWKQITGTINFANGAGAADDVIIRIRRVSGERLMIDDFEMTDYAAAPEIAVSGNGANITDGDTTPATADHTDFGSVGVVGSTLTRTYTITNSGAGALTLGNVTTSGTHAAEFVVTAQPSSPVAAAGSTTFTVEFNPVAVGTRTASLSFTTDDADENPFNFDLQGTGVAAAISNSPGSLSFATTVGNSPASQSFGLTNVGLGTLSYTISTNAEWLSVSPVSGNLSGGAGQQVTVSVDGAALTAGTSNATITVTDAAATNSPQTVSVSVTISAGATAPSVGSPTAAAIGTTTATLGGTIVNTNNASVTERGVYWSTSSDFTPPGQGTAVLESGTFGNGAFTVASSSLPAGSTIYFKAYATNSAGAGYSAESSFITVPHAPAVSAASAITPYSFQANWSAATGATNYVLTVATDSGFTSPVAGFSGLVLGNVTVASVTGLTPVTTYYYRLYTQGAGGSSTNTPTQTAATIATTATVSTASISGITTAAATGGGTVSSDGGSAVTARGVCWHTSPNPTTANSTTTDGSGTGAFSSSITGLTPGQTYYVRAYAVNTAGTSYGGEVSFTASCITDVPTGLHANPTNGTSLTANWTAVAGATGYRLDVSTSSAFVVSGHASSLFFSEYAEGSSNNKYIEIFNGTGNSVDLSTYRVLIFANGGTTPNNTITLSGTLANGATFVIENSGDALGVAADLSTGSLGFTGNDAVALTNTAAEGYLDVIGQIGVDPGAAGWGTDPANTTDNTIRRKSAVSAGDTNGADAFDPATEWDGFAQNTIAGLGSHTFTAPSVPVYQAGYSNRAVVGTSASVTGLTQGATYYMRVRATTDFCTTPNSTNSAVTTLVLTPNAYLASASSSASEGDGTVNIPVQLAFAADATVQVASAAALSGADYAVVSTQLVFTGGSTQEFVSIALTDDALAEATETFSFHLAAALGAVVVSPSNHTLSILDNEPAVNFSLASTSVAENVGTLDLVVYKSAPFNNVSGEIALTGSAVSPGDYTLSASTFTLNGGTTSATITITFANDGVAELTEFATLSLSNLAQASTGSTAVASVRINDEDSAAVPANAIAVVGFHMTDPDDFAFVALTNIAQGVVIRFTDKGWDGAALTGNEGVLEWLAPGGGITGGTVVAISNEIPSIGTAGTIGTFSFAVGGDQIIAYSGAESAPTFLFGLNNRLGGIWQGTYTNLSDSVLPAGLTPGLNAVALTNIANARYNGPMTGDVAVIQAAICTPGYWVGSGTRASVVLPEVPFVFTGPQPEITVLGTNAAAITNNDASASSSDGTDFGSVPVIGSTVDRVFTIANSGSASLSVTTPLTISGPHASDFTVEVEPATTVGSGVSTTFQVRFDPSATGIRTAVVQIANSDSDENPYSFTIVGTGAQGPAVAFGVAATNGTEGGPAISIPLNIASTYAVTVNVAVAAGGSATPTSDYTLSATQFVFTAGGATGQALSVSIVDDASIESPESFTLQVAMTSGGTTGSPSSVVVTLNDNDTAEPLYAGDVAIIGRRKTDDTFALMALTNLVAGQTIYFTDNGWASTNYRGSTSSGDMAGNEDLIKLTINQAVSRGTIIRTTDTGDSRWTWVATGSIPGPGSGSFSTLALPDSSAEQIYAFAGDAVNPLANFSTHLFVLDDSHGFEPATSANNGDIPPGLSSNAGTAVSFAYSATDLMALDMNKVLATSFVNKADALAFIANAANWTSSGVLPSGVATFGLTCEGGRRPLLVSTHAISVNAGSNVSFAVSANDPTCFAPSLTASNLPSGATFASSLSGTNRSGTFSWTPSVANTGVHLVVFYSSDGTLVTQRTVRVNVGTASDPWSLGVPASIAAWSVPVTNFDAGSSGNATVQWVAANGVLYNVYATESTPGAGVTPWTIVGTVTGAGSSATFTPGGGTTQRFYQVVLAGESPSTNGIWGVVRPNIVAGFNFFGAPLAGDRALNGEFGAILAASLTGDPNGVGTPPGDELHVYQPGSGWLSFYLNGGAWYESGGAPATTVLEPGVGMLLLRNGGTVQPVFTGEVGNRGTSTNTISAGWNIVALSEGRALPVVSAFDNTAAGTPIGDYDETLADVVAIHNASNGAWRRLQRLPTGDWMDLQTFTIAGSIYLLPGQAVYYYRQSGDLKVRF